MDYGTVVPRFLLELAYLVFFFPSCDVYPVAHCFVSSISDMLSVPIFNGVSHI